MLTDIHTVAGAASTHFEGNKAKASGGDINADGASYYVTGAVFTGSTAKWAGSISVEGNSTIVLDDTRVTGARSKDAGGCVYDMGISSLLVSRSTFSNCSAGQAGAGGNGGAVYLDEQAQMVLEHSTIRGSTAGALQQSGGAIFAAGSTHLVLDGSNITHNLSSYGGGGLSLDGNSTLTVRSQTIFQNNMTAVAGGAMRLYSNNFGHDEVYRMVQFTNNTAPNAPDISYALYNVSVTDSGNAANLITSDGDDGVLRVRLKLSGRHGAPSDDDVLYVGYDSNNRELFAQAVRGVGQGIKEVAISFKRSPGEQCSEGLKGTPVVRAGSHTYASSDPYRARPFDGLPINAASDAGIIMRHADTAALTGPVMYNLHHIY